VVDTLPSYALDSWFTPEGEGEPVRDSSTGEPLAVVSSAGVNPAEMLEHARKVGGPQLRAMTFRGRVGLVQALATHLSEHKEEFYALCGRTGNTPRDAAFDVEGGLNALFVYAKKGKTDLPEDTLLLDGSAERLGKKGGFVGQHVYVPLHGVAVHINAYNFPVWGMLEKLAPALIAGVPVIVKPASQTAFVTQAVVRRIIESGVLPAGSLQLICGSVGDLLDHLTGQDVIAFTGSGATADRLRSHPTVVSRSVRFNAESDSLNAAILGPDATPGTEEFDLFIKEVAREMTHKAGQKCTAVRRAFVPRETSSEVLDALKQRLSKVRVGNAGDPGVTMGPLVSLDQREAVRAAVDKLSAAGEIVFGSPRDVELVEGDPDRGAFISPVLLWCEDATRPEPHEIEAFGPVCTVMPYDSVEQVIDLAAKGCGSLVATLVTHDAAIARRVIEGVAPWHGRLLLLDRNSAPESTGHGAALAQLVHGGPGRAGGGEELGGMRGLHHYLQRTALQGSPDMITSVTRRWVAGAERHTEAPHPFRKYLEDLRLGDAVVAGPRTVTLQDIEQFAELTGDKFYAHMDEEAARANPFFEGRVAHGYLVAAIAAGLFVDPAPGPVLANYGLEQLRFLTPVNPGDELTVTLTAKEIRPRKGYGEVSWDSVVTNQDGVPVAEYDVLMMVANRPAT
jgi:oxepin-CoA hydrolase / 3-oxo-5,6-dehydrosuberyl-CoA semialdehyde dehydrogenase